MRLNGTNTPTKPVMPVMYHEIERWNNNLRYCVHRAINPPKRNGPIPEKSYFTDNLGQRESIYINAGTNFGLESKKRQSNKDAKCN